MTFIVFPTVRYRRRCWLSVPATSQSNLHAIQPLHATKPWLIPPKSGSRGKAAGRNRWASASMATLPTPFTAYSKGPGLTELLRLYALRSPASPFSSAFIFKGDRK
jgi:hypothetical protein